MRARQRFQQAGQVASGIDDPMDAALLQSANQALQLAGHGWILKLGKKRPVEIRRDDFDRQAHSKSG